MDRSHKLEAPNNEELRTIEQIEDRSGVAAVYREPVKQFEGEILSADERDKVRAAKIAAISAETWKASPKIGFLLVYPFVSAAILAALLYVFVAGMNSGVLIAAAIFAAGFWMLTSYSAYAKIFKAFYSHGLRATPFFLVMLASVFLGSQAIFSLIAMNFAGQLLVINVLVVSVLTIAYSIAASYIVLIAWSNTRIKAGYKVLISVAVLIVSGFLALAAHIL